MAYRSATDFLDRLVHNPPACVLLDIQMPKMRGDALEAELRRRGYAFPVVFMTANEDFERSRESRAKVITKPFGADELLKILPEGLRPMDLPQRRPTRGV